MGQRSEDGFDPCWKGLMVPAFAITEELGNREPWYEIPRGTKPRNARPPRGEFPIL